MEYLYCIKLYAIRTQIFYATHVGWIVVFNYPRMGFPFTLCSISHINKTHFLDILENMRWRRSRKFLYVPECGFWTLIPSHQWTWESCTWLTTLLKWNEKSNPNSVCNMVYVRYKIPSVDSSNVTLYAFVSIVFVHNPTIGLFEYDAHAVCCC